MKTNTLEAKPYTHKSRWVDIDLESELKETQAAVKGTRNRKKCDFKTAKEVLDRIIENKAYERIGGTIVDMFTASILVRKYERLTEAEKAKIDSFPFLQAHEILMAHK